MTRPFPVDPTMDKETDRPIRGARLSLYQRYPETLTLLYDSTHPHFELANRDFREKLAALVGDPEMKARSYDEYTLFLPNVDVDVAGRASDDLLDLYDPDRVYMPIPLAMAQWVMREGVIESIPVWTFRDAVLPGNGRQRTKWCRLANLALLLLGRDKECHKIKCEVRRGSSAMMADLGIMANEHRIETPPHVKYARVEREIRDGIRTIEESALLYGVTERQIRKWCDVASATPEVRAAVTEGALSVDEASALSKQTPESQRDTAEAAREETAKNGGTRPRKKRTWMQKKIAHGLATSEFLDKATRAAISLALGIVSAEDAPKVARSVAGMEDALRDLGIDVDDISGDSYGKTKAKTKTTAAGKTKAKTKTTAAGKTKAKTKTTAVGKTKAKTKTTAASPTAASPTAASPTAASPTSLPIATFAKTKTTAASPTEPTTEPTELQYVPD